MAEPDKNQSGGYAQSGSSDLPLGGPLDLPLGGPLDMPLGGPLDMPLGGPLDMPLGGPMDGLDISGLAFEAATEFSGARPGMVFKTGIRGLGYYQDIVPVPDPSLQEYVAPVKKKDERKVTVAEMPEQEDEGVTYYELGVDYPIDPEEDCILHQCARIKKIQCLEQVGPKLKELHLIANCVDVIEGLETCVNLEHLELYQNLLKSIENISHLKGLKILDLSFNKIRAMENLNGFPLLEKLYLSSNKISDVEGISNLTTLTMLELGSNRIRSIPPNELANLTNLQELWLGKNKITSMALPRLPALRHLSMQNNRLETWNDDFFENCSGLTHLYLGHNNLPDLPEEGFRKLTQLEEFDFAKNRLQHIPELPQLERLREFWANDNEVSDLNEVQKFGSMPNLATIYLERCPCQRDPEAYKKAILAAVPNLSQLDAIHLDLQVTVINDGVPHNLPGIRKA